MGTKRAFTPTTILAAIDAETRASRRGVKLSMVPVLANAGRSADIEKVEGILLTLRERKLIRRDTDGRLWVTDAGKAEMRVAPEQAVPAHSAPPMEGGFKQPAKVRDTIRPLVGGAPKPVTRQLVAAAMKKARQARRIEQPATQKQAPALETEQPDARPACTGCRAQMGEHHDPECPLVDAFSAGRITGDGSSQALPPIDEPSAERMATGGTPPMSQALLERCAAMHLTLLAQAKAARDAGEPGAESELAWLMETGEQLLAAGGAW